MDFQDFDEPMTEEAVIAGIINDLTDNATSGHGHEPVGDNLMEINNIVIVKEPIATTSNTKSITVEKRGGKIQEFIRTLRPNLPRKSKSRAYNMLKNIAKGITVESTFQRRFPRRKANRRGIRKLSVRNSKKKFKSVPSLCNSDTESYESDRRAPKINNSNKRIKETCCRCAYSCCKISRY